MLGAILDVEEKVSSFQQVVHRHFFFLNLMIYVWILLLHIDNLGVNL